jgi:arylsulfatase A-like enzyme
MNPPEASRRPAARSHQLVWACFLLLANAASLQAVTPVPTEILPERIPAAKPSNAVFILSDDHRFDAMGFLGHQFAKTPVMDSLAANGAHINNALVTTALCSPSRASILTGLHTFRHRVIDNNRAIPAGAVYFPQYLQKAGYATGFIGKWHMGGESDEPQPGWDHWVSFRGQGNYLPPRPGLHAQRRRQAGETKRRTHRRTPRLCHRLAETTEARRKTVLPLPVPQGGACQLHARAEV